MNKSIPAAAAAILVAATGCQVEKTQDGEMPEVTVKDGQVPRYEVVKTQDGELPEVEVDGEARLPRYDIDGPEVDVEVGSRPVRVPTVDVDVTPADEDND